jgi:hypothetical protein
MALRSLYVNMDEILDAMDSSGETPKFFLDLETGQIELWMDPLEVGEEPGFDPDDTRYAEIPQQVTRDEYAAMEAFVAAIDEEDVQRTLRAALTGRGAFGRFREGLSRYPDLRARWDAEKRERILEDALDWLHGLGIEPQYELRPLPVQSAVGQPHSEPGQARIGLFDLLLLGGLKGTTELDEGRVSRVYLAAGAAQARKVFARLARELAEHHGIGWRKRLIEGQDSFSVERCHLSVVGRMVDLQVDVPQAIWDAFAKPPLAGGD